MTIATGVMRFGLVSAVSMGVTRLVQPITSPITETGKTLAATLKSANNRTVREAELRDVEHQHTCTKRRMALKTEQRNALFEYAERSQEMRTKFETLDDESQKLIADWNKRFAEV